MKFIFLQKLKYCTKEFLKVIRWAVIAALLISAVIVIKYSPVYEVSLNGNVIGYVKDKNQMEDIINKEVLASNDNRIIFKSLNAQPTYSLKFISNDKTNEEEIKQKLSQETTTMYRIYAIALNNETKAYVNTQEEAQQVVDDMKKEYQGSIGDLNITVNEKYTDNVDDLGTVELAEAKTNIDSDLRTIKDEKEKIAEATCNGVYLSVKPVAGNITSRYGAVESIRNHVHAGIDVAAHCGTNIKAAASGKVSYSGWMSGYGNFIIIDHDNGVQTCYGHCSKLYTKVGQKVEAGDVIAAVGSTGNSTGNHLHFEIRVNGTKVNPQKYLYK